MTLPILILSLPGCEERLAPLRAALSAVCLPHEVLPGVDARLGLPPAHAGEVDRTAARRRMGSEMSDREFGCALSHRAAYGVVLERGWPGAIVLEDDARPLPGFAALARGAPPPAGLPSIIGGQRDPRALGLTHPKQRAARFLTRDYWRRRWRKHGSERLNLTDTPAPPAADLR